MEPGDGWGAADDRNPPASGIMFRGCRSESEQQAAGRLLAGGTALITRYASGVELFGLWDLTAAPEESLVGAAATRPLDDDGTVGLCGIAVATGLRRRGLGGRLVCEVADVLRRQGVACLVDELPTGGPAAVALLRRCGFAPADARDGRLELDL